MMQIQSEESLTAPRGSESKQLSQYQLDNFDLLVVFDNRKVAYGVGWTLLWFGIGIGAGLAFAYQAAHTP